MVYPFAGVMLWLALTLWDGENRSFARWVKKVAFPFLGVTLGAALLAVLVYLPVVLWGTGWRSLAGNGFVQPLEWRALFPTALVRLQETADEWTLGLPVWAGWGISAGALMAMLLHSRFSRECFSPLLMAVIGAFGVWLVQRGNPMARLWTYLIPLWVLGGAVGLWQLWAFLRQRLPWLSRFEGAGAVVLLVVLSTSSLRAFPLHAGEVQQVADLLVKEGSTQFFAAAGTPDDAPLWFYLMEAGAGRETFERKRMNSPESIFVVVRSSEGQTPQNVLAERGLMVLPVPLRAVAWGVWLGYLALGLALSHHISTHDYYSLPLVPFLALGVAGLMQVFLEHLPGPRRWWRAGAALVLIATAGWMLYESRTILKKADYRAEPAFWQMLAGQMGDDARVIGLLPDYGARLTYWGWITPANWWTQAEVDLRRRAGQNVDVQALLQEQTRGKDFFVITLMDEFQRQQELQQFLAQYPLFRQGDGYLIVDLRTKRGN
ncbi:hypothetical protein, partial [Anaerolinea sp.]|uniref:hypothetical protein n=1 Tax=Anaerolinea sp. TaxID=1872519 RepID=UPI002ACEB2A0